MDTDPDHVSVPDIERCTLFKAVETDSRTYAWFTHPGGYSSAHYTYTWDKVIAEDFFEQFDKKNLLAGPTLIRYRRVVLEPGGSMLTNDW
jgi:thimet oligopeptidase